MPNLHGKRGDRHQHEYTPLELQRLVAAQGFQTWVTTVNVYRPRDIKFTAHEYCVERGFNMNLHGDTIIIYGIKVSEQSAPYRLHPIYHHNISSNKPGDFSSWKGNVMNGWLIDL